MTIAILVIVVLHFIFDITAYVALYNGIVKSEEQMKAYFDRETLRVLTAMFNRERMIQSIKEGEEVEI